MSDSSEAEIERKFNLVMTRHPEVDPHTVLRYLRELERPPFERLERALRLGRYSLFKKHSELAWRDEEYDL